LSHYVLWLVDSALLAGWHSTYTEHSIHDLLLFPQPQLSSHIMDRHSDVFFSEEDIARFSKGRSFLGEPLPDGAPTLALASPPLHLPDASGPINILPTADQYQRIREKEECSELHISTTEGESCVTVDSLPFLYGDSSAHDRVGYLSKTSNEERSNDAGTHESCADDSSNEHSEEDGGVLQVRGD